MLEIKSSASYKVSYYRIKIPNPIKIKRYFLKLLLSEVAMRYVHSSKIAKNGQYLTFFKKNCAYILSAIIFMLHEECV